MALSNPLPEPAWGTGTWPPKLGPTSGQDTQLHPPHAPVPRLTQATYQRGLLQETLRFPPFCLDQRINPAYWVLPLDESSDAEQRQAFAEHTCSCVWRGTVLNVLSWRRLGLWVPLASWTPAFSLLLLGTPVAELTFKLEQRCCWMSQMVGQGESWAASGAAMSTPHANCVPRCPA